MSTFEVKVYKLRIEPHTNADTLELAVIGDYRSCVRKGQFKTGDLGVYIPEGAVVPEAILEQLGLVGKLAGAQHNRVKAMKLRGIVSQGLIYPLLYVASSDEQVDYFTGTVMPEIGWNLSTRELGYISVHEGQDVAELLGITKYEPPIPVHMAGEVFNASGYTLKYDIENFKKYPTVLSHMTNDEPVMITEKLHGTWTCFGYHPDLPHPIVTSKGLSGQGLAFKFNMANEHNLYIRSLVNTADGNGDDAIDRMQKVIVDNLPFYILGETYGKGVQDLDYGLTKPHFRAFDIYVGAPGQGRYMSGNEFMIACRHANIETVPVLYTGMYDRDVIDHFTDGKDNINGTHIREGIVVRGYATDMYDDSLGRIILKSVSDAYLLRKGDATEFN